MFDLCVVGGGMSGMTAAITAARLGSKVLLIEKNSKLGKKIYATGNGKCNLSNMSIDNLLHYNSQNQNYGSFLAEICGVNAREEVVSFFNSIGIVTTENRGYIYPYSMQASAVVWAMIDELNNNNVKVVLDTQVQNIKSDNGFTIMTSKGDYRAKKVILSCGGNSYSKLGGSLFGYQIAEQLGHSIVPLRPSLCGLITKENISSITGVRVNAKATLMVDDACECTQSGELQFTDYGISGIMIFNLSSKAGRALYDKKVVKVIIDLIPDIFDEDIYTIIENNSNRTILALLNSVVNDKLASYFLNLRGYNPKDKVSSFEKKELYDLILSMKNYFLHIKETIDYDNAQLTAGGVDIADINAFNLMSKLVKDLYITGEMLDIDGICGGYNITFAVLSGIRAGKDSNDKNK